MLNIAVFASGKGSNFKAIIEAKEANKFKASLSLLVCDNPQAGAIGFAKEAGIKVCLIQRKDYPSKDTFEAKIIEGLEENNIGLIVLAGFMRMLSPGFVKRYSGRIINIHPALLPAFKGTEGIKDAFNYGAKITGVTVHFVDEKMDHGPIILQEAVKIEETDTVESLEEKIHSVEHRIYPEAISLFTQGRLKLEGRGVRII